MILLLALILCQTPEFKYKAKASAVCRTAPAHKHDDVVTVTMYVTSWDGCELRGVIRGGKFAGKTYVLFGGFDRQAKLRPKQRIRVTYDRSCGQVLFAVFPKDPFNEGGYRAISLDERKHKGR